MVAARAESASAEVALLFVGLMTGTPLLAGMSSSE
jgi:hypothetical protein